jgi:UPF0755 protein
MPRRRTSIFAAFVLPFVAALLLAVILLAAFLISIPTRAEAIFGPPNPNLSAFTHYRLAAQLLLQANALTKPNDPNGGEFPFTVGVGESVPSIIQRLVQNGLVSNPGAFRSYLQYSGLDTTLQSGNYRLSPAMTALEIAQEMQDATPSEVTFAVLAGWRIEEVAASLPTSGLAISPEAFLSTSRMGSLPGPLASHLPELTTMEGLLFPGEYIVPRQINAPDLIALIVARFDKEVTSELRIGFTNQSLTLYEAITLASIVERESIIEDEMPLIASVFLNRLADEMKLDADPTVQYALGYNEDVNTWWKNPLSRNDLQFESLYNTYIYPGLPPSPIANPGILALRAVAFPAQTPYYYFRAACDGSGRHLFAKTFQEHLNNACP